MELRERVYSLTYLRWDASISDDLYILPKHLFLTSSQAIEERID